MNTPTLVLPENVWEDVRRIVEAAPAVHETGVSLFGVTVGERRVALAAVGPGPRATQTPVFYQPDTEYANAAFDALRSALPAICWVGELHVHPRGMTWLSGHDHETMRRLLADRELELTDFVAGILQREAGKLAIYPYYFSRALYQGQEAVLEVVGPSDYIVRDARLCAAQAVAGKPKDGPPVDPVERQDEPTVTRHKWLAAVVSFFRRKTRDH